MDSLIASAAHHLARGDPLGALKRVALREDAPALALRGIAMAQLGDYAKARQLLRRAARAFGLRERVAQARCLVAEAEVALAAREPGGPMRQVERAAQVLAATGDAANALHAGLIAARRHLLEGAIEAAEQLLNRSAERLDRLPAAVIARTELTRAELALRRVRAVEAAAALQRADTAAHVAGIPALRAEIQRVREALTAPAARGSGAGLNGLLRLGEVEALFASGKLIVDGCRRVVRQGSKQQSFARRPVLFELVRALAEASPHDVARETLIERVFAVRFPNASHRARLRVEIGRVRVLLRNWARIEASARGFRLQPSKTSEVVVITPPLEGETGSILALLSDGGSWSTSALARALGASQRTVQRALRELEAAAAVRAVGRGRSRRWLAPALSEFATTLLLPLSLSMR